MKAIQKQFENNTPLNTNLLIKALIDRHRTALLRGEYDNAICYDGIVDECQYRLQPIRMAFLLKETNYTAPKDNPNAKKEDWNYVDWLNCKQSRPKSISNIHLYITFRNLCMWVAEFFDLLQGRDIKYSDYTVNQNENSSIDTEQLRTELAKVAIINLKKTWGGSSTNWNDLNRYLTDDDDNTRVINSDIKTVLLKELSLVDPNVVICGGRQVYDFAKRIFSDTDATQEIGDRNLVAFTYNNTIFVDFHHPACRGSRKEQFKYAKGIFEKLIPHLRGQD